MSCLTGKTAPSVALAGPAIDAGEARRPIPAVICDGVAAAFADLARAYHRRRDRRHLGALSDHLLKDISISRGEIDAAVAGLTRREIDRALVRCWRQERPDRARNPVRPFEPCDEREGRHGAAEG